MFKNIYSIVILFSFFNLFVSAQNPVKEVKEVVFYKNTLEKFIKHTSNVEKEDAYKEFKFKDLKSNKEYNIKDLEDFQKKIFILIQFENLNSVYDVILLDLNKDLETFAEADPSDKADNDKEIAKKGDIESFIQTLKDDRKTFLDKYQKFAESFFNQYKVGFTKKEIKDYIQNIEKEKEKLK